MKLTFCEAIARQEGWLNPKSRCRRNHNPGNIVSGRFTKAHGEVAQDHASDGHVFAIFADDEAGFAAQAMLLEACYLGDTVERAIYRYAPPIENDSEAYLRDVCAWTGLTRNTILTREHFVPHAPLVESSPQSTR